MEDLYFTYAKFADIFWSDLLREFPLHSDFNDEIDQYKEAYNISLPPEQYVFSPDGKLSHLMANTSLFNTTDLFNITVNNTAPLSPIVNYTTPIFMDKLDTAQDGLKVYNLNYETIVLNVADDKPTTLHGFLNFFGISGNLYIFAKGGFITSQLEVGQQVRNLFLIPAALENYFNVSEGEDVDIQKLAQVNFTTNLKDISIQQSLKHKGTTHIYVNNLFCNSTVNGKQLMVYFNELEQAGSNCDFQTPGVALMHRGNAETLNLNFTASSQQFNVTTSAEVHNQGNLNVSSQLTVKAGGLINAGKMIVGNFNLQGAHYNNTVNAEMNIAGDLTWVGVNSYGEPVAFWNDTINIGNVTGSIDFTGRGFGVTHPITSGGLIVITSDNSDINLPTLNVTGALNLTFPNNKVTINKVHCEGNSSIQAAYLAYNPSTNVTSTAHMDFIAPKMDAVLGFFKTNQGMNFTTKGILFIAAVLQNLQDLLLRGDGVYFYSNGSHIMGDTKVISDYGLIFIPHSSFVTNGKLFLENTQGTRSQVFNMTSADVVADKGGILRATTIELGHESKLVIIDDVEDCSNVNTKNCTWIKKAKLASPPALFTSDGPLYLDTQFINLDNSVMHTADRIYFIGDGEVEVKIISDNLQDLTYKVDKKLLCYIADYDFWLNKLKGVNLHACSYMEDAAAKEYLKGYKNLYSNLLMKPVGIYNAKDAIDPVVFRSERRAQLGFITKRPMIEDLVLNPEFVRAHYFANIGDPGLIEKFYNTDMHDFPGFEKPDHLDREVVFKEYTKYARPHLTQRISDFIKDKKMIPLLWITSSQTIQTCVPSALLGDGGISGKYKTIGTACFGQGGTVNPQAAIPFLTAVAGSALASKLSKPGTALDIYGNGANKIVSPDRSAQPSDQVVRPFRDDVIKGYNPDTTNKMASANNDNQDGKQQYHRVPSHEPLQKCDYDISNILTELGVKPDSTNKIVATPNEQLERFRKELFQAIGILNLEEASIEIQSFLKANNGDKANTFARSCLVIKYLIEKALEQKDTLGAVIGKELELSKYNLIQKPYIWPVYRKVDGINVLVPEIYLPLDLIESFQDRQGAVFAAGVCDLEGGTLLNGGALICGSGGIIAKDAINLGLLKQKGIDGVLTIDFENFATASLLKYTITSTRISTESSNHASIQTEGGVLIIDVTNDMFSQAVSYAGKMEIHIGKNGYFVPAEYIQAYLLFHKKGHEKYFSITNSPNSFEGDIKLIAKNNLVSTGSVAAPGSKIYLQSVSGKLQLFPGIDMSFYEYLHSSKNMIRGRGSFVLSIAETANGNIWGLYDERLEVFVALSDQDMTLASAKVYAHNGNIKATGEGANVNINDTPLYKATIIENKRYSFIPHFKDGKLYTKRYTAEKRMHESVVGEQSEIVFTQLDEPITSEDGQVIVQNAHLKVDKGPLAFNATKGVEVLPGINSSLDKREQVDISTSFSLVANSNELALRAGFDYYNTKDSHIVITPLPSILEASEIIVYAKNGYFHTQGAILKYVNLLVKGLGHFDEPALQKYLKETQSTAASIGINLGFRTSLSDALSGTEAAAHQDTSTTEGKINAVFALREAFIKWISFIANPVEGGLYFTAAFQNQKLSVTNIKPIVSQYISSGNTTIDVEDKAIYIGSQLHGIKWFVSAAEMKAASAFREYEYASESMNANIVMPILGSIPPNICLMPRNVQNLKVEDYKLMSAEFESIEFKISGKTTLNGVAIEADTIVMNLGELVLKSVQRLVKQRGDMFQVSLGKLDDINELFKGFGANIQRGDTKWVDEMSRILGKEKVEIVVAGVLQIAGAMIANAERNPDGSFTDHGKLKVKAAQLIAENIHGYDKGILLGASLSVGKGSGIIGNSYGLDFGVKNWKQTTFATIPPGQHEFGKVEGDGLNTDVNSAQCKSGFGVDTVRIKQTPVDFDRLNELPEMFAEKMQDTFNTMSGIAEDFVDYVKSNFPDLSDYYESKTKPEEPIIPQSDIDPWFLKEEDYEEKSEYSEEDEDGIDLDDGDINSNGEEYEKPQPTKSKPKGSKKETEIIIEELVSAMKNQFGQDGKALTAEGVKRAAIYLDNLKNIQEGGYKVDGNILTIVRPQVGIIKASSLNSGLVLTFEIIGEAGAVAAEGATIIGKYAVRINPYAAAALTAYEAGAFIYENREDIAITLGEVSDFSDKLVDKIRDKVKSKPHFTTTSSPNPNDDWDPDDDNDWKQDVNREEFKWEIKEQKDADKISRHEKFGKFYRDPHQKLGNKRIWWSKDTAEHGGGYNLNLEGSKYKLFTEYKNELRHIADIDKYGNIIPKHKSDVGKIILKKDLIGIK